MQIRDSERDRIVRELRESYALGTLSHDEFNARVTVALEAQSRAELAGLVPPAATSENGGVVVRSGARPADLDTVERHLSPGEQIEWVGRPDPSKHFTRADVFLVPFTILWGGFAMVWESAAIFSGSPFFMVFGIPFVFVGLYLIAGRFFHKAYRKRRTVYAVTDRRVLTIYHGRRGEAVEATYLRAIPSVSTTSDSHGRGSIEFGNTLPAVARYANSGMWMPFAGGGGFYDIEDPGGVADLVERLREQGAG
jgi:hypothetical protein